MKGVVVMLVFMGICTGSVNAQGIFNQKGSQLKRLAEQVALLHTYSGYLKKGYRIASKGLNTINDIKRGDFDIHKNFLNSLKAINPAIKRYSKVGSIVALQVKTVKGFTIQLKNMRRDGFLKDHELSFINTVYQKLMQDCIELIDELITVTSSGNYEMTDDQRLHRIDELYEQALDQYTFSQEFSLEAVQLGNLRRSELLELNALGRIYEYRDPASLK